MICPSTDWPLRSSSLSMSKGVPAMAPLWGRRSRLKWPRMGVRWTLRARSLPAERQHVDSFLHLLKCVHISAQGHGVTEIKQDEGETPAGEVAVMAWAISPQDPVAPSDRLSSLHVGVTWEEGVNFSGKDKIMQRCFKNKQTMMKSKALWRVCVVSYAAARSTMVEISFTPSSNRVEIASLNHNLMSVTTWWCDGSKHACVYKISNGWCWVQRKPGHFCSCLCAAFLQVRRSAPRKKKFCDSMSKKKILKAYFRPQSLNRWDMSLCLPLTSARWQCGCLHLRAWSQKLLWTTPQKSEPFKMIWSNASKSNCIGVVKRKAPL